MVVWHTEYIQKIIAQLRAESCPVQDEDLPYLSPACFEHRNRLGKYPFAEQEHLLRNSLSPLSQPRQAVAPTAATA